MMDHDKIELRSEEVQEILGAPPRWIIRRGITLISLVVLILISGSYFFRYPDIIKGRVTILSKNPPVTLVARVNGKIDHLFVRDQQVVNSGEVLAILENPAYYSDVYTLRDLMDSLRNAFDHADGIMRLRSGLNREGNLTPKGSTGKSKGNGENPDQSGAASTHLRNLVLGQIHPYYAAFESQRSELDNFLRFDLFMERISTLNRQVADQERYLQQLVGQARILDDRLQLSLRQYNRDSELARQSVISASDLEKSEAEYLSNELSHRTAVANMTSTRNHINQMMRQISELQAERGEQFNRLLSGLREKYDNLVAQISVWEQAYVLKTPIDGRVTFTNVWSENQQVMEGTAVFSVVPDENSEIVGRVEVPVAGSGKIEPAQRVKIKLDNYPHLEYGMLEGRIISISLVPYTTMEGTFYTAELELPSGLVTNYGMDLPFSQEMKGSAEIITNDRRLLERFVQPLTSVVRDRILTH